MLDDDRCALLHGDCLELLKQFPDNTFDSCVTDPPFELGFMGKSWDSSGVSFSPDTWRAVLRALKPGRHLLAFSGTRTSHRMVCAITTLPLSLSRSCAGWCAWLPRWVGWCWTPSRAPEAQGSPRCKRGAALSAASSPRSTCRSRRRACLTRCETFLSQTHLITTKE